MRFVFSVILFFSLILSIRGFSQSPEELTKPRILILLDESSSMVNSWSGHKARYEAAKEIILHLMDSIYAVNNEVEFSLRALGEQHTVQENDCYDTKNEVMFSRDNRIQMALRLDDLHPLGVTPIAFSLKEAAENDLMDEQHYAYSIILITDGGESCGGDICDVVKTLISHKVYFKPYIVSMVDYAPLKTEYACLGDYLQVTSERDVPKAVSDIVNAYRPMLQLKQKDYKEIQTILANPPSVLKLDIPPVRVPVENKPKPEVKKEEPKPVVEQPQPVVKKETPKPVVPKPTPVVKKEEPKPVAKETPKPKPEKKPAPQPDTTGASRTFKQPSSHIVVQETAPIHPRDTARRIPVLKVHRIGSLFVLDDEKKLTSLHPIQPPVYKQPVVAPPVAAAPPVVVPPVKKLTPPKPKPVAKTQPPKKTTVKPAIQTKEVTADIEREPAKQTSVSIYFKDSHGKYYSTTPVVYMIDPKTSTTVKKFYRTTDANGTPDPQELPAGNYNLSIAGQQNLMYRNAVVEENMNNKIIVHISDGSLKFSYDGAPNRPVTEFTAIVAERKDYGGKTIKQKCTMELEYEPGNYLVEVNTLPPFRRNLDLDFYSEYDLRLPQPGDIQFTNQNKIGKVSLYYVLGDEYARFYTIDVDGNPAGQKLQLLPGPYQAHFMDPKVPYAKEVVVPFNVKSNEVTELELK